MLAIGLAGQLISPVSAAAQTKTPPHATQPVKRPAAPASNTEQRQEAQRFRARVFDVLRQTARDARAWEKKEIAVSVESRAADLLWEADEPAARELLAQAWETAGQLTEPQQERSRYRNYSRRADARSKVLLIARRRDNQLAQKWVEELAQEKTEGNTTGGLFDDRTTRSNVLLQMAMSAVKDDPQAAARLAIESMDDGISFGLQNVLIALQAQSFEQAEPVFQAALNRLATVGMRDPNELLILYSYLYSPGRIGAANTSDSQGHIDLAVGRNTPTITPAAQYRPALAASFLNLAADLLINAPLPSATADPQTTARTQISAINLLLGKVQQVAPDKATVLANHVQVLMADAKFTSVPPTPPDGYIEPQKGERPSEYNARRVDYLEKQAEQEVSTLRRDIAFAKAATTTEPEDYERGWRIAGRISDKQLSADVTNWLTYRATLRLLEQKEFDKAYALNAKNEDAAQRAVCLVVGAQRLSTAKESLRAGEWLREASGLLRKATLDENWTKIALGIVAAEGRLDSTTALYYLQESVRALNQSPTESVLAERAPAVQRFTGIVPPEINYDTKGFSLDAALASFNAQDFESVYSVLRNLEAPEVRGLAVVALCQQALKTPIVPSTPKPVAPSQQ
jgi:DNA-binding transcriptional MerR regulator